MSDSDTDETDETVQPLDNAQKERMLRYLYWGGFIALSAFGVFAAVSFYWSVMEVIDIWVGADFEPVFEMLFNLAIILVALLCLSLLVRRFDISVGESESQ